MAVHVKFRSAVDYDSILIDDQFISVASLKDRIIEQKNLGKSMDFNLVITDAQSGEEYGDTFLVPRNMSVIIKRVPATRAMSTLQVNENSKSSAEDETTVNKEKSSTSPMQPLALSKQEIDSMDEFGFDLYAIPDPLPTKSDDEKTKVPAMHTKTAAEWPRQTQDSTATGQDYTRAFYCRGLARGRAYLRSTPPPGYVCHRCGQPGHFIQHCPTNGDSAYDMRREKLPIGTPRTRMNVAEEDPYNLPDGSVGIMQPDETVLAKEADACRSVKSTFTDPPPELRCSLCQAIFHEAVMVPCCHYSFCDKCIRQDLVAKGKCPHCGSTKLKIDDLLPNIALRQAINRFLDLQDSGADETKKQHQVPGTDSALDLEMPAAAISRLQIELRRPSALSSGPAETEAVKAEMKVVTNDISHGQSLTLEAKQASPTIKPLFKHGGSEVNEISIRKEEENLVDAHPPVMKDVSGFAKVQNKKPAIGVLGGGTVSKVPGNPSLKEAEGVALESEISKGKRKKKRTRQMPADGVAEYVGNGKSRKGDRYCYSCGSPGHLARDCTEIAGPYPFHPGNFPPGGPMPVGGIPPYGAEMFWHGQYMPPPARPFPIGYGDGMYGPPGPAMHFDVPVIPPGPFVPPYMPPFYQGRSMHSHSPYMGGGVPAMGGPAERPLTREEFLELQERERRRRLMQESQEREWVQDRSFVKEGMQNSRREALTVEPRVHCAAAEDQRQSQLHRRDLDHDSVRNYSDENEINRSKSGRNVRKHLTERLGDNEANWRPSSSSYDDMKSHKPYTDNQSHSRRSLSFDEKEASRYHEQVSVDNAYDSDLKNDVDYCYSRHEVKKSRKSMHGKHNKHFNSKRVDVGTEITNRGDSCSTYQKDKKSVNDNSEQTSHSESKKATVLVKHDHAKSKEPRSRRNAQHDHAVDEDGAWDFEVPKRKKHHSRSKSTTDMDGVDYELDAPVKRKKKHYKKHHEASSKTVEESKMDHTFDVLGHSSKHLKYKSKHDLHSLVDPPLDDFLEDSRWQLDSGLDEAKLCHTHRSKRKRNRAGIGV